MIACLDTHWLISGINRWVHSFRSFIVYKWNRVEWDRWEDQHRRHVSENWNAVASPIEQIKHSVGRRETRREYYTIQSKLPARYLPLTDIIYANKDIPLVIVSSYCVRIETTPGKLGTRRPAWLWRDNDGATTTCCMHAEQPHIYVSGCRDKYRVSLEPSLKEDSSLRDLFVASSPIFEETKKKIFIHLYLEAKNC